MRLVILLVSFIAAGAGLFGQSLTITSVRNRFSPNGGICPGCVATVHYSPENLTFANGQISALVNGKAAQVDPEDDGNNGVTAGFDILIPTDAPSGLVTFVVTTPNGNSLPVPLILEPYVPTLLGITDSVSPRVSASGDIVTVYAGGLGALQSGVTVVKPGIVVGGVPAEVLDATLGAYGTYRIRFVVPPGDGYHLLEINMGGKPGTSTVPLFVRIGAAIDNVTAADYSPGRVAPETILVGVASGGVLSTFGPPAVFQADARDAVITLGGTSIKVKDSAGAERLAPLYYVSSSTVGYLVPAATASGPAIVTAVSTEGKILSTGRLDVAAVAPRFFSTYDGSPRGYIVRLRNGVQTFEDLSSSALGIDMGPEGDVVYVVLWASGVRGRSTPDNVTLVVSGFELPVEYAGAQSQTPGVDQVNVRLPRYFIGQGRIPIELVVDGKSTNTAHLNFK